MFDDTKHHKKGLKKKGRGNEKMKNILKAQLPIIRKKGQWRILPTRRKPRKRRPGFQPPGSCAISGSRGLILRDGPEDF